MSQKDNFVIIGIEEPISNMTEFRVVTISSIPNPQQVIYAAMHQDYITNPVADEQLPSEETCGNIIINSLLKGDRGHYGPLEHVQIVFNCINFPHSVMQQLRTHRVGVSFDCQSLRYTSEQILAVARDSRPPEDVFYLRDCGNYHDRKNGEFCYDSKLREQHLNLIHDMCQIYADNISWGMAPEQARGLLPFDYRQHFVFSTNMRSLMHVLDLRSKQDAQLEIRMLCELLMEQFRAWAPALAGWYEENRWGKARLAP